MGRGKSILAFIIVILVVAAGFVGYKVYEIHKNTMSLEEVLAEYENIDIKKHEEHGKYLFMYTKENEENKITIYEQNEYFDYRYKNVTETVSKEDITSIYYGDPKGEGYIVSFGFNREERPIYEFKIRTTDKTFEDDMILIYSVNIEDRVIFETEKLEGPPILDLEIVYREK